MPTTPTTPAAPLPPDRARHGAQDAWTEGPWCVLGDGVTVAQDRKKSRTQVCRAFEVYGIRSEREANARLIAAAPALYAALSELNMALNACRLQGTDEDITRCILARRQADSALTLAAPSPAGRAHDGLEVSRGG